MEHISLLQQHWHHLVLMTVLTVMYNICSGPVEAFKLLGPKYRANFMLLALLQHFGLQLMCSQGGLERVAVAVRSKHLLATAFHPELTDDLRW